MHVFLHFKSFGLVVLQLILASKLSELEQFEKQARNCLFANKIEFSGKRLHPREKLKKTDKIQFCYLNNIDPPKNTFFIAWQLYQFDFGVIFTAF